jgi:hypothetical protein
MKVLTVYAHHNARSFCRGVLERFTEGLRGAGHADHQRALIMTSTIFGKNAYDDGICGQGLALPAKNASRAARPACLLPR